MDDQNLMIELTAEIVANYISNNQVSIDQLPDLIRTVNATLSRLGQPETPTEPETSKPTTALIRKSIRADALISFIDGKPYKTLKRHLSKHGLSVAEYKERYGLPKDYPTTAADYSARRSEMARNLGLGRQRVEDEAGKARRPKKGDA